MDNLLFISVFNYGAVELGKNHLKSLLNNNITNYVAYVIDDESYKELTDLGYNVIRYEYNKRSLDKYDFGSLEFDNITFLRYKIILDILNQNKDVWYLDIDIVVLENLNNILNLINNNNYDCILQNDINMLCSGCMYFKSNQNMKNLMTDVLNIRIHNTEINDQVLLNSILKSRLNNINITSFPIFNFPNGLIFFGDDYVKTENREYITLRNNFNLMNKNEIYLVHANWMVGIDKKIQAFKDYNLWLI